MRESISDGSLLDFNSGDGGLARMALEASEQLGDASVSETIRAAVADSDWLAGDAPKAIDDVTFNLCETPIITAISLMHTFECDSEGDLLGGIEDDLEHTCRVTTAQDLPCWELTGDAYLPVSCDDGVEVTLSDSEWVPAEHEDFVELRPANDP